MTDLSFNDIFSRIKTLGPGDYDLVVGIKEGGKIPAILISYQIGCDLCFIKVSRRNEDNEIIYDPPKLEEPDLSGSRSQKILIVDDVSVSGATMEAVKNIFKGKKVSTLVLKGKGDIVLFPEIEECVNWPWR